MLLNEITYFSSGTYPDSLPEREPIPHCLGIVVHSGTLCLSCASRRIQINADGVLLLSPNEAATLQPELTDKGLRFFWVRFSALPTDLSLPSALTGADLKNLREICNQFPHFDRYPNASLSASNRVLQLFLLEVNLAASRTEAALADSSDFPYEEIRNFVRENAHRKLSADDVSKHFGYSRDYLTRCLKRENLPGLKRLIVLIKCDYIKELLSKTDLPLKEIGLRTGFSETVNFFKFFKTHTGETPSEYRSKTVSDANQE